MRNLLIFLALLGFHSAITAQTLAREDVFPIEKLPAELRPEAERILLRALDREALYTIVGGLKPMSSGFLSLEIEVDKADLATLDRTRQILSVFRSGNDISASLQPFYRVFEGKRFLDAVIFHHSSFRSTITKYSSLFAGLGISPRSEPIQAVMAIDRDPTPERNRAYGYFFGYPEYAVDFFVKAEESRRVDGKFVERDFVQIPTFESPTGRFVYAVPKGHVRREEDETLAKAAKPILDYYRQLREDYIGEGKRGVVELIRDWFSDGKGEFSPEIAREKALRNRSN
ncbi:MAG: hypothetical protein MUC92_04940 [Fimbriimonadaceae bacterium]|jgi:hypothetical protein|nr:hypothetical protein [Fimbriimonadaceae bacterium]